MKSYEYILFDADNTLFDFDAAELAAFSALCRECGLPYSEGLYRAYSAINDSLWKRLEKNEITADFLKVERFRRLLTENLGYKCENENDRDALNETAEEYRDCYMENLSRQSMLVDGAEEVCRALSSRYKLYIITNGIGRIQRRRFSSSVIYEYFTDIFISEEIGAAKPACEYFDSVISAIGDPDRRKYLVVGDSLTSDCDGAIYSGIDICRYNPANKPSDGRILTYNIRRLDELENILDRRIK